MTQQTPPRFTKVLVANRGEIAVRVIRTAKAKGYPTVAVYSDADAQAPHVALADEAVCLGPGPVGENYLNSAKILAAAERTGADAIHPGYGFLSENAEFAEACVKQGITFIGPPVNAIRLMGSKRLSKIAMIEADVPCIPGYEGEDQADETLISEAKRIGLPVMLKASAGGGGRGMRLVHEADELAAMIKTARSEATNAFGSGELIIEKAVINPRHIEIQVFADTQGNVVYLGERDCSIQRRHQKVVEEAPSPFVDHALRERMGKAAVQAAKACNYEGAGTVEFLVDQNKNFYFLEMNTRLQVEHPVTELITGTDLVAWQLDVASDLPLPLAQDEITLTGHAIEVRLYAEDAANQFMPQTGQIVHWLPAQGEGIRIDAGIREGQAVTPFYDPMLAKVIAYGANREEARRKLIQTLNTTTLFGVTINSTFLRNVIAHDVFRIGEATTGFLGDHFQQDPSMQAAEPTDLSNALATILLYRQGFQSAALGSLLNWRSANRAPWPYELRLGDLVIEVGLSAQEHTYVLHGNEGESAAEVQVLDETALTPGGLSELTFVHEGIRRTCRFALNGDRVDIHLAGTYYQYTDLTHEAAASESEGGSGRIVASMDGSIIDVCIEPGQAVKKGQTLLILEAMKMEHPLKADMDGVISEVHTQAGAQVKIRQLLVTLTAENAG